MKRSKIALIFLSLACACFGFGQNAAATPKTNDASQTSQELKVLTIEIDPTLNSISGKPRASKWLGYDVNKNIREVTNDINEISHGYIKVKIVKREYLNEFPTYTYQFTLSTNGKKAIRYDEKTYIKEGKYDATHGDFGTLRDGKSFIEVNKYGAGNFDYQYLIKKFNLAARRNKGEFDQVWLFIVPPIGSYETMMVGRNTYGINGGIEYVDCDPFAIAGFEITRPDSMLHSLGHMTEEIISRAFGQTEGYNRTKKYNIKNSTDYQKLNYWERFTLYSRNNNDTNFASIGNTHNPYNAAKDYDYSNTRLIKSNWKEWENYPNVPGKAFTDSNSNTIAKHSINKKIVSSSTETNDPDRLYQRFWFSHMPHITGITKDGHQNNWWKYWFSLNYVDRIKLSAKNVSVITGSTVTLKYTLQYALGNTENKTLTNGNNVSISDRSILDFVNGTLKAKKAGTAKITVKHDGIPVTYTVTVADKKEESPKPQPSNNTQPQPDNNTQPELDDEQPIEEDAEDDTTPEEDGDDDQNEEYTEDEEYYEEIDDDGSIVIRRKENVEETEEDDEEKPKDFVQFLIIFGTIVGSLVILAILIALIISYNRNAIKP